MNKLVKGTIAGAAGIALLLGGAGSFALWNASATVGAAAAISSGTLTIAPATGTSDGWKNGGAAFDTASGIVPGDVLTFTKTFTVTATGANLSATVGLGAQSITAKTTGAADVALAAALEKSATFTVDGATTTTVIGSTAPKQVVVTATITFPKLSTVDNTTKSGVVDLSDFTITLTQN